MAVFAAEWQYSAKSKLHRGLSRVTCSFLVPRRLLMSEILSGISVLMTAYNAGKYLQPAVESILNQSFRDIEFVIVNDGSTDRTAAYLDSIEDSRVKVFHEHNRGTAGATNFGLQFCTRKYVMRMDADDISMSSRAEKQYQFMESNPDVALVGTQVQMIGDEKPGWEIALPLSHDRIVSALMNLHHGMCHGSSMFRNELIQQIGGYWKEHRTYDDWDMFLRISEHGTLANLPEVLYQYRLLPSSLVGSNSLEMRAYYQYAVDRAMRRKEGRPAEPVEVFLNQHYSRPWMKRKMESIGVYALDQYRVANSEICHGSIVKGYGRLAWAAFCSPKRTVNRISRTLARNQASRSQ